MSTLLDPQKMAHLRGLSGDFRLVPIAGANLADLPALENVLVPRRGSGAASQCWGLQNHSLHACIALSRAAYEDGREVPYDGRDRFVHKVDYLATAAGCGEEEAAALVAQAILQNVDDHLFIVEIRDAGARQLFEELGFRWIADCPGGGQRLAYLAAQPKPPAPCEAETALHPTEYLRRLTDAEWAYHAVLKSRHGFDITELLRTGWTGYRRADKELLFSATFGTTGSPPVSALRLDVFDATTGSLVAYCDLSIPGADFALQDEASFDFVPATPDRASNFEVDTERAQEVRGGWPAREGIWVRVDCRRAGIGQALERVAGDLCKLAYPGVREIGVLIPEDNVRAYEFHRKASATEADDPLYCLQYLLDSPDRPGIEILYGL